MIIACRKPCASPAHTERWVLAGAVRHTHVCLLNKDPHRVARATRLFRGIAVEYSHASRARAPTRAGVRRRSAELPAIPQSGSKEITSRRRGSCTSQTTRFMTRQLGKLSRRPRLPLLTVCNVTRAPARLKKTAGNYRAARVRIVHISSSGRRSMRRRGSTITRTSSRPRPFWAT